MIDVSGPGGVLGRALLAAGVWRELARDGDTMPVSWRRIVGAGAVFAVVGGVLVHVGLGSAAEAGGICNRFCDGKDAGQAAGDRVAVSSALYGRSLALHVSDSDPMGWGSVDNGSPGDEVWLDRSFDGGRSWSSGSRLGNAAIPAGARGTRTPMFNVDDWAARGVGVLRACGKAGDRAEITCTGWARSTWNAWDRRTAAATALMMRYDQGTGLFDGNAWWTSANALTALIDNIRVSGMGSYTYAVANTYDKNVGKGLGQFRNEYIDDTGWWGLAWVAAYDATGDARYLTTARADADYMHGFWDGTCGGGVWWSNERKYKAAIANSLYIQLNAALAQRIAGDTTYRGRAQTGWNWFQGTGMISQENLVIDGIDLNTCKGTSGPLTYNSGVLINALVQLNKVSGDANALTVARRIGDAATTLGALNVNGITHEPGESDSCDGDQPVWKGAFVRGLGVLDSQTGGAYGGYLRRQADSAYAKDRSSFDGYGNHWAGPYTGTSHGCQASAVDLLNAAR